MTIIDLSERAQPAVHTGEAADRPIPSGWIYMIAGLISLLMWCGLIKLVLLAL